MLQFLDVVYKLEMQKISRGDDPMPPSEADAELLKSLVISDDSVEFAHYQIINFVIIRRCRLLT